MICFGFAPLDFNYTVQGHFPVSGTSIQLPQCQLTNPEKYEHKNRKAQLITLITLQQKRVYISWDILYIVTRKIIFLLTFLYQNYSIKIVISQD